MLDAPLISIVVPNFNSGDFVSPFIESVINQTYKNWELIFVDDGSFDNSINIIEEYVALDNRIKLYRRQVMPKGACSCRNIGFDLSRGEYICFFDSDDLLPIDSIENRMSFFKKNPFLDFVVSPAISYKEYPFDLNKLVLGIPLFKDDLYMFLKRYRLPFGVWTNTYKKSFLLNNNIKWDVSLASLQDSDYNIQCLLKSPQYMFSDNLTPVYYWRVSGNPNSITKKIKSKKNLESQIYFYSKLCDLFNGTQYMKPLKRFGLTILLRCAEFDFNENVAILSSNSWDMIRFKILKCIYKVNLFNKLSLIFNLIFFPFKIVEYYLFLIDNRIKCHRYFKMLSSR